MSEYIEVGQPLQFTDPNTPTRVGEIVENVSDIYNIPSPRLGMQVFVKSEKKSFVITSLKSKVVGGVDVPEAAVEAFEPVGAKSFTWNNDTNQSNMNDFVVAGVYDIKGERTRIDDNLPILNTGGGHSFNARLTVLDSSISGSGEDDDKCITQVLSFSNRLGQGEVYIRTGKGSSLDNLTWENWSTLQRNVNVDTVTSLDNLVDNGIYSGVYAKNEANIEIFVMVVINNYALADIKNMPKSISQFKYSVSLGGSFAKYETRVGTGVNDWGEWEILNKDEIDSMIKSSVDNAIKGVIADAPEAFDTLREIADWIANDETGAVALANAIMAESQRAQAMEQQLQDWMNADKQESQTADAEIKANAMQYDTLGVNVYHDKAEIYGRSIDAKVRTFDFPAATTEKAGVMSAEDKKTLGNVPNTIKDAISEEAKATDEKIAKEKTRAEQVEQTLANDIANAPNLALRALYVAAGAEYNDTDNVIMKTAPWGDSVEHLPKHYYLNGLGDITENEMSSIYVNSPNVLVESAYAEKKNRTFILNAGSSSVSLRNSISGLFCNCNMAETIGDGGFIIYNGISSGQVFYRCTKLKHINSKKIFGFGNASFSLWFMGCTALITCKIDRLAVDVSFLDSPNISYDSILYIINNIDSELKKSITITLHHDAYARLTADNNIVAALDAKNTLLASQGGKVSLVCAIHNEEKIPNA